MLGNSVKVELPRRVVALYLLCSLIAFLWLVANAVSVTKSIVRSNTEDDLLAYIRHSATLTTIDLAKNGDAHLQALVERFSRERDLLFCAFVGHDDTYIAHSLKRRVGHTHQVDNGITTRHEEIEIVRYTSGSLKIREYRSPIQLDELAGRLIVAKTEPTIDDTLQVTSQHAFVVLCGPPLLIDGANAARDFLLERGVDAADARKVWLSIGLHTTPEVPRFLDPEVADVVHS